VPSITVHKFGGASLADADAVAHAVEIASAQPPGAVIVVSALAGVTDALLDGARKAATGSEQGLAEVSATLRERHAHIVSKLLRGSSDRRALLDEIRTQMDELDALAHGLAVLRELTPRTSDYIASRGERLSARIVAAAITRAGRRAHFIDGPDVIRTNGQFGGASADLVATDRAARATLLPLLRRRITPVVPGFIGATPGGEVATLGRGGSDLTATLLGRALRAESVTLWKDVPGLLTADPRIVSDARVIPQLNAREWYVALENPKTGVRRYPAWPMQFSFTDTHHRFGAPTLGEQRREILTELGLDAVAIDELEEAGVTGGQMAT